MSFRDEIEALDGSLIPALKQFPIEQYAAILRSGKAAATKKRYATREAASRDAAGVRQLLVYYRQWHPELAPDEFGMRVWESAEDGRYRWAILPEAQRKHRKRAAR